MLVVIGDTHGRRDHRLAGPVLAAVREADLVLHTGDFTTERVYDAIDAESVELRAVHGNNDEPALREELPAVRTVEWGDGRIVLAHGHDHTDTALSLLARQEDADLVVVGHSHRPRLDWVGDTPRCNPGSYAQPRQYEPGYAKIRAIREGYRIRLCQSAGDELLEVNH